MQIYARKMGLYLLELADNGKDSYSLNMALRLVTSELNGFTHCMAATNPKTFQEFHSKRVDGLQGPNSSDLTDAFHIDVLVRRTTTSMRSKKTILHCSLHLVQQRVVHTRRLLGRLLKHFETSTLGLVEWCAHIDGCTSSSNRSLQKQTQSSLAIL